VLLYQSECNHILYITTRFVFLMGLALSALMYFAGVGAFNDVDESSGLEGIGLLIIGIMLIAIAIVGVIATVVGAIVLIIGSIIGEAIVKALFYRGQSFGYSGSGSSRTKYCKKCGAVIRSDEKQCPKCGN